MNLLLKKDELSKFDFISTGEFFLALLLMILSSMFSFLFLPYFLKKSLFGYKFFFESHYFGIVIFLLSSLLNFFIIYYFCCLKRKKSLREGLFLSPVSLKVVGISLLIGLIMPLISLPVIFKFAPSQFYAMDIAKTKSGLIYLFSCALFAPVFEEMFYRGFVFPFFQSKLNSFWAVVITALFFGFSHFMNIGNAHILLSLFIFYGFVLTLLRCLSRSLIASMVTHFTHNATLITAFLLVASK